MPDRRHRRRRRRRRHHRQKHRLRPGYQIPDELMEVIEDPLSAEYPPDWQLIVGDHNLSDYVNSFSVNHEPSGAIVADIQLSGRFPRELVNAPAELTGYLDDWPITLVNGYADRPVLGRSDTAMVIQSPMAYMERSVLNEEISYKGSASTLVRRVLIASRLYNPGKVRVRNIGRWVTRKDEEGFQPEDTRMRVLEAISEETGCVYRDTVDYGCEGFLPPMGSHDDIAWSFEANESIDWAVESDMDKLYKDVVVERKKEETTNDAGEEIVIPGFKVRVGVRYKHMPYKVHPFFTDWIVVTDDDEGGNSKAAGKRLATQRAREHGRQAFNFTLTGPFNPFLRLWDMFLVGEDTYDILGRQHRTEWLVTIENGVAHENLSSTTYTGAVELISEELIKEPKIHIRPPQHTVVETPGAAVGIDAAGFFFDNLSGGQFIGTDAQGFWIDPAIPGAVVGNDQNGFYIDV